MAAAQLDQQCTLLISGSEGGAINETEIMKKLESKNDADKISALKAIILATLQGENFPRLRMHVIKYCINTKNHALKKVLLNYWEVVEKRDDKGQPLHEMILVCQAMKNDLDHPNEYVRGCTLRFLCKLKEPTVLESLVPSITANLSHRHSFVRKNAMLTLLSIYRDFPDLIPDAPELVEECLQEEKNPQAKKNAFLMLSQCSQNRALRHLDTCLDTLTSQAENFQLVALDLIRKACRANPAYKGKYIRAVFSLVQSNAAAVSYQGANTLVALSSAPTAIKAAVQAYTGLLQKESDTNVKLIIIGRIAALKRKNSQVLSTMVMDILSSLSSPNLDLRKRILELVISVTNNRNVGQVVQTLQKEMVRTDNPNYDGAMEYRRLLVDALHDCAVNFPSVVRSVSELLMNYLTEEPTKPKKATTEKGQNSDSQSDEDGAALSVVDFLREICEEYRDLSGTILKRLCESLPQISIPYACRVALWILGEYSLEAADLDKALNSIREALDPLPLMLEEKARAEEEGEDEDGKMTAGPSGPQVLADGTYASQSLATEYLNEQSGDGKEPNPVGLRQLLLAPDYFLASTLAASLTKLVVRFAEKAGYRSPETHEEKAKALQILVSLMRLGELHKKKKMDKDSSDRITHCIHLLLRGDQQQCSNFLARNRVLFKDLLHAQRAKKKAKEKKSRDASKKEETLQADLLIHFRQLKPHVEGDNDDDVELDLSRALGGEAAGGGQKAKLERVYQLTGFADPIYCEALLRVLDFNIVLDFSLLNRTKKALQNVTVHLFASGELRVMDKPIPLMLAPGGLAHVKVNLKVGSADSGVIFGNLEYDSPNGTEKHLLPLANIRMDIMDYIVPATCSERAFRAMWAEFEWENKIAVNTEISDLNVFLDHLLNITNMTCQTPRDYLGKVDAKAAAKEEGLELQVGSSNFLAANLYAKSMFGECALLNVSVERNPAKGTIVGYYRIRTKTQGIALSLGDRITSRQRTLKDHY